MKFGTIIIAFLLAGSVRGGEVARAVRTTTITLHRLNISGAPLYLDLDAIQPNAVISHPTEALGKITRAALDSPARAQEARSLIFHHAKESALTDSILILKGQTVNVVMMAPGKIIAVARHESLVNAVKLSFMMIGAWSKMTGRERSQLRRLI